MGVLLVVLGVIVLPGPRLLEPVRTICHLMMQTEESVSLQEILSYPDRLVGYKVWDRGLWKYKRAAQSSSLQHGTSSNCFSWTWLWDTRADQEMSLDTTCSSNC